VLVATLLVIGMIVGLTELRNQVLQELYDVAVAVGRIAQSYSYSSTTGHAAATAGSAFQDKNDYCDQDGAGDASCLNVHASPLALEGSPLQAAPPGP
jgi:hypothetical protein